ncbi:hypothetical protein A0H81_05881 [Grifola frondosa]|uniref:Uncharacterized protein n=1 Tax=Grifola frondosa TaxID=5627 RepID=A0A1C7M9K3_GRIFR|nr:hypothetical protein A0H81_05881 [Grifola frondosa]
MNPSRSMSSRLTIVRVPPSIENEEPSRRHRRHGSNASTTSNTSGKGETGRLSFAFTSFSSPSGAPSGRPASPSTSPRLRPQSPGTYRYSGSLPTRNKLSPEQLVDLARNSCNPRPGSSTASTPVTPTVQPLAPASFTPLPDSIFLPFINRPEEVSALISSQPTAKLFALLQQTFPPDARASMTAGSAKFDADADPKKWAYTDLEYWLKMVDRDAADDVIWVHKTRACVLFHSELIWERIKGALGVPPELDVDDGHLPLSSEPAVSYSDLYESAVIDSPVSPVFTIDEPSDEISIEPVFANSAPPPSSAADTSIGSSLHDLREEDEEAEEHVELGEPEIHGLRISTSPSVPAAMGGRPGESPSLPGASPTMEARHAFGHDDRDLPYDVSHERGPGHPLFPSNFSQLALAPTLRANKRAQSVSYPPPPAYGSPMAIREGVHRTGSMNVAGGRAGRVGRPEWARSWDPAKHEYAVTTSTGSVGGQD